MNLFRNIKNNELPTLIRVCHDENNGNMEYTAHDLETIDLMLGVTVSCYKHKRQRMTVQTIDGKKRLVKAWAHRKGRHDTWTYNQEEFLRENYPTHSAKELAAYLGRKENAIQWKAKRMGLKKAFFPGRKGYEPIEKYYNPTTFKPKQII